VCVLVQLRQTPDGLYSRPGLYYRKYGVWIACTEVGSRLIHIVQVCYVKTGIEEPIYSDIIISLAEIGDRLATTDMG